MSTILIIMLIFRDCIQFAFHLIQFLHDLIVIILSH